MNLLDLIIPIFLVHKFQRPSISQELGIHANIFGHATGERDLDLPNPSDNPGPQNLLVTNSVTIDHMGRCFL